MRKAAILTLSIGLRGAAFSSHVTVTPGLLFKVENDGSAYTEVATAGLVSHVNHGRCEPY